MEPYLDRLDLFYIWPLGNGLAGQWFMSPGGKLQRMPAGSAASPAATISSTKSLPAAWSTGTRPS